MSRPQRPQYFIAARAGALQWGHHTDVQSVAVDNEAGFANDDDYANTAGGALFALGGARFIFGGDNLAESIIAIFRGSGD